MVINSIDTSTGGYMYVWYNNSIIQVQLSDPSITNTIVTGVTNLGNGNSLAIDSTNSYLYVSTNTSGNGSIYRIQLSLSNPSYTLWFPNTTGFQNVSGITVDNTNTYLYVAFNNTGGAGPFICRILISDPTSYTLFWMPLASIGYTIALDYTNEYMYVGYGNGTIDRIQMSTTTISNWISGLISPTVGLIALDHKNTYMYISNDGDGSGPITQIQISNRQINYNDNYYYNNFGTGNGIVVDSVNRYLYVSVVGGISRFSIVYPCFKKGTRILTDKGYFPIESLKKGDLIRTVLHGFVPINMIGKRDIVHEISSERITEQLYKCTQAQYPEVFEDLVLTGCHSILVDEFKDEAQKQATMKVNNGRLFITDNYYRLPACADDRASVYEIPGTYTIYHLALEHEDYLMNYGIYANGLLVESCSQRYLKELSQMELF